MAHAITERDGLFTVREPAWHGIGKVLEDYPTKDEAKAIAHPWEPTTEPLFRVVTSRIHEGSSGMCMSHDGGDTCAIEDHYQTHRRAERVPEFDLVIRDDDGGILGVKPETRSLVSNEELYDIAEAIQGSGSDVLYETGGSLKGGRKVWLLLRLAEPLQLAGDKSTATIPYFALQNAHDGSGSFRGQATMTRIVCDNTSKMADLDAKSRGTEFTFRHTSNVGDRIEEAKQALAGWRESVQEYQLLSEHLLTIPVSASQRAEFVREFIPMPPENLISERVRNNVVRGRIKMGTIFDSPTQEGIAGTVYGLVQGAIEYGQHERKAKSRESLFQRAYLDRSRLSTVALDLAMEVAR